MNLNNTKCVVAGLACGLISAFGAQAKTGAPHTVSASANYTDVQLSWSAPSASKELKWHDGRDYNGDTAPVTDRQKTVRTYVAARFDASDLKTCVGDKVEAITFFQYRPVVSATVMVYEDGKVVASAVADPSAYAKNTTLKVMLPQPVEIKDGSEYMFAVCYEAGTNMDFVAIKDSSSDAPGKGDLMSTDGENWVATAGGDYLITANLFNDADEIPDGYNVYRDNQKLNDTPIQNTSFAVTGQPEGQQSYSISAIYGNVELKSASVDVNLRSLASVLPSPTFKAAEVDGLNVALSWAKPLLGGDELTWSDKSEGISIGGSAASNTKVWVRNDFESSDLVAFCGGSISAINFKFAEAVISDVTLFVTKDGVIVYSEPVADDKVKAIKAGDWTKFELSAPCKIEAGHAYSYGLYVLHTPKAHPMSVDGGVSIDVKGNSFSTSAPNSKSFNDSKPSWKTLKSGGMEGNWLMTADIDGAPAALAAPQYDVYRDGKIVNKAGIDGTEYEDVVENLGSYVYSVVARSGDKSSFAVERKVNVKLPAAYSAPLIENSSFDNNTKEFNIVWNMDKEISHCGAASYMVGFDEEMPLMWGSQFSAAELASYKGYSITKIKFCIGDEIGDLTVGVYTTKGKALSTVDIPAGTLTPAAVYTVSLPEAVKITGDEDLVMAYSGTLPAGSSPIILDEGPLVDGGAKISLSNGLNWLNLSTLNPTYAKYNIFISAMASEDVAASAPAKVVEVSRVKPMVSKVAKADCAYGVEQSGDNGSRKVSARNVEAPKVKSFNVYRNGELVQEVSAYEYSELVSRFATMSYYVTTVFTNGWESAPSEEITFTNRIAQKSVAPFGLIADAAGNYLKLEWQAPENSTVLSYVPEGAPLSALRMSSSSSSALTSYCASKFSVEDLKDNVGQLISHIQFGAGSTEINSCSVIVIFGENVVYTQTVPVASLVKGINDVRLNEPVEIPEGVEVGVGFVMNYAPTAPHPLGSFECADHTGYGDLISSSASSGFWYNLHTKFKLDYCWYIKAVLSAADIEVAAKAPARTGQRSAISYNIYRDGILLDNVSDTNATIFNAQSGAYYVTAVDGENESGESNMVVYTAKSGVDDIASDVVAVTFDSEASMIITGVDTVIEVYSASGALVASGAGASLSVAQLQSGVYMVKVTAGDEVKIAKIVK